VLVRGCRWVAVATVATGLLLGFGALNSAAAADQPTGPADDVRLGVRLIPPFVVSEGDRLGGFSVELWNEIAREAGLRTTSISPSPDVSALIGAVEGTRVDAGIAAISITSERKRRVDFSQPMFDSGLGILTATPANSASADKSGGSLFSRVFSAVLSRDFLQLSLWILVVTLIPAHIIYFIERQRRGGMVSHSTYLHGIAESYFWSITALASQAENSPRTRVGRGVAVVWMYFSVIFIAFFTAGVTSSLTSERLLGTIAGPQDLPGNRIVTVAKSTAAAYLVDQNIDAATVTDIDAAYRELAAGRADAVVYDAPVLRYYETHRGKGHVHTVGGTFHKEGYGIALPKGSPLRQRIDVALLKLRENGTYERLVVTWFGSENS
jgi:polar amino acid transport system substrate-binding protein